MLSPMIPAKRRGRPSLAQKAQIKTLPAPTGGWNARDPLPSMKPEDAIVLDNLIPGVGGVSLRKGSSAHATGLGDYVETLMEYAPPSGVDKLFAATPGAIYDVTAAGAVGSAVVSSLSNGRWQHTMFATTGGNFLVACNGQDDVRNFDGSTWTAPTLTGVTSANLVNVAPHASRLWFAESGKLDPWYLDVAAIAGAATKLVIAPFCKLGGELTAIGSWTHDGGDGMDDYLVLVTSKGEVVVYQGTDPASADTWAKVGTFKIGQPVGRRCLVKVGGDLGIITSTGVALMSQMMDLNVSGQGKVAITNKISGAFTDAYNAYGSSFGWQVIDSPTDQILVVNVPVAERVTAHQYVMNLDTGGWCRFKALNAGCWAVHGGNLYFGTHDGRVCRYGVDYTDDGATIDFAGQTAFYDFKTPQNKHFKMARPLVRAPEGYSLSLNLKTDYDTSPATISGTTSTVTSGSVWDEADWDVASWEADSRPTAVWQSLEGIGQVGSIAFAGNLGQEFVLNSIDVATESGGFF